MSRFGQEMRRLEGSGSKEREEWQERMKGLCRCPGCATYNECTACKKELLFCILGKSQDCQIEAKVCDCPVCKVTDELELKYAFYCRHGSESQLL